ncbi:CHAT domain-containing protein [Nucisporomicrobium flavum]|uniref:CHAT domain-containing protein n=1 Tax=Nucisporomicrobium flavum TaxID=2785915 RepID=UPI003C2D1DC1
MDGAQDLAGRITAALTGDGDLDAAIAAVHRLPGHGARRGEFAAELVEAVIRREPMTRPDRLRALDGLLVLADADPPRTARWRRWRAAGRAMALAFAAAEHRLPDADAALAEIDRLAADAADAPSMKPMFASARLSVEYARAAAEDDAAAMTRLAQRLRTIGESAVSAGAESAAEVSDVAAAMGEMMAAQRSGADVAESLRKIRAAAEALPPDHPMRATAENALAMSGMFINSPGELNPDVIADLASRSSFGPMDQPLVRATAAIAALADEVDPEKITRAIDEFRTAIAGVGEADAQRPFYLTGLALALFRLGEVTNSVAPMAEAETVLVDARRLAGGPRHPQWTMIAELLADVRSRLGLDSGRGGLDGMRAHVWQVLKQPDLAGASIAARDAAVDAVGIARRCLAAHDVAGALQALDAGRGLALFAATEAHDVGARLEDAGRHDLAARWRAAVASRDRTPPPDDLRREVLRVAYGEDHLLDPPSPAEISAALLRIDADALIYLVAGDAQLAGYAVIAAAGGGLSYMALPNLHATGATDLDAYLAAAAGRDLVESGGVSSRDLSPQVAGHALAGSLDALCDWAWRAAIGPIIERYLTRVPVPASRRPHRIVLVPMGELARIPWQAARRRDGAYAVQFIAISQVASARMLCRSAALAPVAPSPLGLVVGDPDTGSSGLDLPAARAEAYAIHRQFYLGARYVGRRPDGSVSPSGPAAVRQVRSWLTATSPAAGSTLHLACHALIQTDPGSATSYLLLAGGQRLTVDELVGLLGGAEDRAVGLVVLAACSTGLSVNGYDEAYSLGTAFLAAGVRSVLFTQWKIPDAATSVLMYMFHRYRMAGSRPVWDALRRAQLWMLDPQRQVPPDMPQQLRDQLDRTDPAAVVGWAGFVHGGQ